MSTCGLCGGTGKTRRVSFVDATKTIERVCSICRGRGTVEDKDEEIVRLRAELDATKAALVRAVDLIERAALGLVPGHEISAVLADPTAQAALAWLREREKAAAANAAATIRSLKPGK